MGNKLHLSHILQSNWPLASFLGMLGLRLLLGLFSSWGKRRLHSGLRRAGFSPLSAEPGSRACELQRLLLVGWRAQARFVAHELSCSAACAVFLDQGSNLCLLHWQADSLPLNHQGIPGLCTLKLSGPRNTKKDEELFQLKEC